MEIDPTEHVIRLDMNTIVHDMLYARDCIRSKDISGLFEGTPSFSPLLVRRARETLHKDG
jgi:hypothetical protein